MGIIVCDSACDLWKDQVKNMGVEVLNFPFSLDGVEQEEQLTEPEEFDNYYDKLRKGATPSTSLINQFALEEYFEEFLKAGEDVLFIHFSGALTSTFDYMEKVRQDLLEKYPQRKFYVVDTLQVTMAAGILVYQAVNMYKNGATFEKIVEYLEGIKQNIACYFGVDNLFFLKRGGRISTLAAVGGTLLGVKPMLKCDENGKIIKVETVKGRKAVIQKLVSYILKYGDNAADFPIIVMHASCEKDAKTLQQEIIKVVGEDSNVWVQPVGPIIGTHCGPDTIAVVFRAKHR